jgi:hypothetical protein
MAAVMSTLSTFSDWMHEHSTWTDLQAWLKKDPSIEVLTFEGSPYVILKNKRDGEEGSESMSDAAQLCRSVIWNTDTNSPCCVSPFAAKRDQKVPMNTGLRLEDFVEGVMVNLFRARDDDVTHIATRSRLDADGTFYSEQTFRELFEEAMNLKGVTLSDLEKVMGSPNKEGVSATFMSVVLAHPEHRVVRSVEKANFWVIFRGVVHVDGCVEFFTDDLPVAWRPKTYNSDLRPSEWSELKEEVESIKKGKPWYWQGLVVHYGHQRWRFRNADHERVRRDLRGSESNAFARFLRLRANSRVKEYLRVYPEDSDTFHGLEDEYRSLTRTLYAWYCRCHKEHSIVFKELPKSVQPLVFGLHKEYLDVLRPKNEKLHLGEAIDWLLNHLKTEFGIPSFLRFSKEELQPPPSATEYKKPAESNE